MPTLPLVHPCYLCGARATAIAMAAARMSAAVNTSAARRVNAILFTGLSASMLLCTISLSMFMGFI